MSLRPYQTDAIERVQASLETGNSVVLQMPTGSGKTKTAVEIIASTDGRIWFLCHRREIVRQTRKALTAAGVEHGGLGDDARVLVLSVQAVAGHLAEMTAPDMIVWDECHHVAAGSWSKIRDAFPHARHLGLTATPERLDGKGLDKWFDALVCGPSIKQLVADGHLSPMRYLAPSVPDLTKAKMQAGDYAKKDTAEIMGSPVLIGDAVAEYTGRTPGKRAIAFCASVAASKELVARFVAAGVPAGHVDGSTKVEDRDAAIEALRTGEIKVLSNVEVFTEGFDLPDIDVAILLRPTKSLALFLQMIGRALRPATGKAQAIIFDHAGLYLDHGLPDAEWKWSLEGGARRARLAAVAVTGERVRRCPECKEARIERAEVCGCGFVFPTGREIGEFDGVLRDVGGVVPEGCITAVEFAIKIGVSRAAISKWIAQGMPSINSRILEFDAARAWLERNQPRTRPLFVDGRDSYVSTRSFAKMVGVRHGVVLGAVKRGQIPHAANGWLPPSAVEWWVMNFVPPNNQSPGTGFESPSDFAVRHGISEDRVRRWRKAGMPAHPNGWVNVAASERWMAENINDSDIPPTNVADVSHYMTKAAFARLVCISDAMCTTYCRRGMPTSTNGWVHAPAARQWLISKNHKGIAPQDVDDPGSYESVNAFDKRIGAYCQRMKARGLPCASNGWVHIQRGLEWVRDNTKIEIPPEAWPAANENAPHKEAA